MSKILVDVAAERAVLAGIARYNYNSFIEVSQFLNSTYFTIDSNKSLYDIYCSIFETNPESKVDIPIILSTAAQLGLKEAIQEDRDYIKAILNFHVERENLIDLAKKVQKLAIARELYYEVIPEIQEDISKVTGGESLSQIVGIAENRIIDFANDLSANKNEGIIHIADGIDEWMEYIESHPVENIGLSMGLPIWDKMIGGIRRQTVNIIAARPGQGKSLLACKAALNVCNKYKAPCLLLDTEMNQIQNLSRILAIISGVGITEIETGQYVKNEIKLHKVKKAAKMLKKFPFRYVNVAGMSFNEILSFARRWIIKDVGQTEGITNDCLIIYDYFKLMNKSDINRHMQEYQAVGFQLMEFHDFVLKHDIAALAFAQLNREHDIADSDRILRFAESVSSMQAKTIDEIAETGGPLSGNKKMSIMKARFGENTGDDYINVHHDEPTGRFTELQMRSACVMEQRATQENSGNSKSES